MDGEDVGRLRVGLQRSRRVASATVALLLLAAGGCSARSGGPGSGTRDGGQGTLDASASDGAADGTAGGHDSGPTMPDASAADGSGPSTDAGDMDADVMSVYDSGAGAPDGCVAPDAGVCSPVADGCSGTEVCDNGADDDCDGQVDEGCACAPGAVQPCFLGPPGRRHVGSCVDGTQRCEGSSEFGSWGACTGGISPSTDVCDSQDNDCNGCTDDGVCCIPEIDCPGPGDPRVPDTTPFATYVLRGELFYSGPATAWHWSIEGGPCDSVLPTPTYTVIGVGSKDAFFIPTLSGDYRVTMTVTTPTGDLSCTFIVHVAGPGLRVELCWDRSTDVDLDLYLHRSGSTQPWYDSLSSGACDTAYTVASHTDVCGWDNCEGALRTGTRPMWGYANTALSNCQNGPGGTDWSALGYCANPRLDIDNNLVMSIGTPENVNLDDPHDGDTFRVMVQNFTGTETHPMVNIYCDGRLVGTYGAAPDLVPTFSGSRGSTSCGAMWRVVDVTTHVDASGGTTGCDLSALHPPAATSGYWVTTDDASY